MAKVDENTCPREASDNFSIAGSSGCFSARFISSYNALLQVNGFKSEEEALAWLAETKRLAQKYY